MNIDKDQLLLDALDTAASQINIVVVGGAMLCLVAIGQRLIGGRTITVHGLTMKTGYFVAIVVLYTVAHYRCAKFMEITVDDLLKTSAETKGYAWCTLEKNGPLIFQGMEPRKFLGSYPLPIAGSVEVYSFPSDFTLVLSLAMVVGLTVAIIVSSPDLGVADWRIQTKWQRKLVVWIAALAFGLANWGIGSWWASEVSKLHVDNWC
ncbi:hypothetical protein [Rhizobium ruizarguesonis]|uniref:hypothetical protein n=1 Tax=Rhizobium ruizarguesonis TaxID=2081791 RepID=UPI0013EE5EC0|nr:hypothetical protein [Rhizobium ruizarguesonis]